MLNSGALNGYALNQSIVKSLAIGEASAPLHSVDSLLIVGEVLSAGVMQASPSFEANGYTGWVLSANLDAPVHTVSGAGQEFGINFAIIDNPASVIDASIASGEVISAALSSPAQSVDIQHIQTHIYIGNVTAPMVAVSGIGGLATYADVSIPRAVVSGECGSNYGLASMPIPSVSANMSVGLSMVGNILMESSGLIAGIDTGYVISGELTAANAEIYAVFQNEILISANINQPFAALASAIISDGFIRADITQPAAEFNGALAFELNNIYTTYAMNIENAKVTQYMDYPALAMAKLGGVYLSVAPDGIYLMDGDSDDGNVIDARVRFGMDDMGTDNLKRVQYAYVGSRGSVQMKMFADGDKETSLHDCTHDGNGIKTSRIKMGKGTKSRYWQPEIQGNRFEIDSIKLESEALSRKVA